MVWLRNCQMSESHPQLNNPPISKTHLENSWSWGNPCSCYSIDLWPMDTLVSSHNLCSYALSCWKTPTSLRDQLWSQHIEQSQHQKSGPSPVPLQGLTVWPSWERSFPSLVWSAQWWLDQYSAGWGQFIAVASVPQSQSLDLNRTHNSCPLPWHNSSS